VRVLPSSSPSPCPSLLLLDPGVHVYLMKRFSKKKEQVNYRLPSDLDTSSGSIESSASTSASAPSSPSTTSSLGDMDSKSQFPHGICNITPPALPISPAKTTEILHECATQGRRLRFEELWMPQNLRGLEFGVPHLVRHDLHGCKSVDKEQMHRQKGVLTHLIKNMGANLLEGKSVINVSLPVRIFEPRSFLQRISDAWAFAPLYLTTAARSKNPVERMKWVITFLIAGIHRGCIQLKPFNPILGETAQGFFPDGTSFFCEQVSHHPPISAFQVFGPDSLWRYEGYHEVNASFRPNGLIGYQVGPNRIQFSDGTSVTFNMPKCKVSGILFGDRLVSYTGPLTFEDTANQLIATVELNPDAISGLKSLISTAKTPADTVKGVILQDGKPVSTIEGSWLWYLAFDSKVFWALGQYQPFEPIWPPDEDVLPSDSRFRSDLIYLAKGDEATSQKEKERLEEEQRYFRKLRAKHTKQQEQAQKTPSKGLFSSFTSFFSSGDKSKSATPSPSNQPSTLLRACSVATPICSNVDQPAWNPESSPNFSPCRDHVDPEPDCPNCLRSDRNSAVRLSLDPVRDDLVLEKEHHPKKSAVTPRFI